MELVEELKNATLLLEQETITRNEIYVLFMRSFLEIQRQSQLIKSLEDKLNVQS